MNPLPVSEVVKSFKSSINNTWGVEGYNLPRFNAHLDKPFVAKIRPGKKITYIDTVVKAKKFLPSP